MAILVTMGALVTAVGSAVALVIQTMRTTRFTCVPDCCPGSGGEAAIIPGSGSGL